MNMSRQEQELVLDIREEQEQRVKGAGWSKSRDE